MNPPGLPAPEKRPSAEAVAVSYIYAARYEYSDVVLQNDNHLRLFPRSELGQTALASQLWVLPPGIGGTTRDRFGNVVQSYRVTERHTSLVAAKEPVIAQSVSRLSARSRRNCSGPAPAIQLVVSLDLYKA